MIQPGDSWYDWQQAGIRQLNHFHPPLEFGIWQSCPHIAMAIRLQWSRMMREKLGESMRRIEKFPIFIGKPGQKCGVIVGYEEKGSTDKQTRLDYQGQMRQKVKRQGKGRKGEIM